ncbi:cytochrome ubiquinol oxidase subunit I, partial [Francisella tularensis subsp. holarctica]|uniref:cytochrome ubiquinol oxidase subunit I n=1 Tax=Francisella tularensis TaxID=263 RepID=UPI002381C9C8
YVNSTFDVYRWYHVIVNPSVIPRYIHMLMAAYLSTLKVILGVSAYYLIKDKYHSFAKTCNKFSLISILILSISQLMIGDDVGREV